MSELRAVGSVVEAPDATAETVSDIVAAVGASGVVTFSEYQLELTATVAGRRGFTFHDPPTATLLTDKYRQRRALAAAGVEAIGCRLVTGPEDVPAAVTEVGLPAILKPRRGAGSRDTHRITGAASCAAAVEVVARAGGEAFVVEELLEGASDAAGSDWGDYVSVESVATAGVIHHVCVTGKFPLAEPFRETGQFVPATLSPELTAEVTALAGAALRALGVRFGATHVEIKLTPDGPRIIEVNGRIGGYVNDVLRRASGYDLLRSAIQVAVGEPAHVPSLQFKRVAFRHYLSPPGRRVALKALRGVSRLRHIAGVEHVEVRASPGQVLDPSMGTQNCLGVVYGASESHSELKRIISAIATTIDPVYATAP